VATTPAGVFSVGYTTLYGVFMWIWFVSTSGVYGADSMPNVVHLISQPPLGLAASVSCVHPLIWRSVSKHQCKYLRQVFFSLERVYRLGFQLHVLNHSYRSRV
jgi:hypothetical protein